MNLSDYRSRYGTVLAPGFIVFKTHIASMDDGIICTTFGTFVRRGDGFHWIVDSRFTLNLPATKE